jgi:Tfp pilus assembly protein PilZ
VQLQDNELGRELRKKVEGLLAGALQSSRPTHTI